jgi:hypothetical protein
MKTVKTFGRVIGLSAVSAVLAVVLFYSLSKTPPVVQVHAQDNAAVTTSCTLATIGANYGVLSPLSYSAGDIAAVGSLTANGKGSVTWTGTYTTQSEVEPFTLSGTYTLSSNCSGTMTVTYVQTGETLTFDFVVVSSGNQIDILDTTVGTVRTWVATKIN